MARPDNISQQRMNSAQFSKRSLKESGDPLASRGPASFLYQKLDVMQNIQAILHKTETTLHDKIEGEGMMGDKDITLMLQKLDTLLYTVESTIDVIIADLEPSRRRG